MQRKRRTATLVISLLALMSMLVPLFMTLTSSGSTPATTTPGQARTGIQVDVTVDGELIESSGVLCGDQPAGAGRFIENPAGACALLEEHADQLMAEPATDCDAEPAGPEQALVRGAVDGRQIEVTFDRATPCGAQAWEDLAGLLGPGSATVDPGQSAGDSPAGDPSTDTAPDGTGDAPAETSGTVEPGAAVDSTPDSFGP